MQTNKYHILTNNVFQEHHTFKYCSNGQKSFNHYDDLEAI